MQRIQKNIIMYYTNHCKNNMFSINENKESIQYYNYCNQYSMSHYSQKLNINTLIYSHLKILTLYK